MCSGPMYDTPEACERAWARARVRLAAGVRPGSEEGSADSPGSTSAIRLARSSGSTPPWASSLREGSTRVAAHRRCSVSRSDVPSSTALRVARLSSSCEDSVSSLPMGTRCTAGGEEAGDIPKNRFSISLNGSEEPKGEPNAIDMSAPEKRGGNSSH